MTWTYLSHGKLGGFFPQQPNAIYPTLAAAPIFTLNTFYRIPMAYYNNADDASFYPTSTTSNEFGAYPFLNQMPTAEGTNFGVPNIFTDDWNVGGQQDFMVGSSTSLRAEESFGKHDCSLLGDRSLTYASLESAPSVASYPTQTNGYDQLPYPDHYWPVTDGYAESCRSGIVSRDNSFVTTGASEASMADPTPSSSKHFFLL